MSMHSYTTALPVVYNLMIEYQIEILTDSHRPTLHELRFDGF